MDTSQIIQFVLFFPGFLFSLSFHEAAHGWMANKFGDPTALRLGRVTLNPLPHMDPIGTVLLPAMGFFLGGFIIGWGVPVPVDYRNLKHWKRDGIFIAAAGPASNFLLALIFSGVIHFVGSHPQWIDPENNYNGFLMAKTLIQIFYLNLALAFFNLIPLHPLDGGKILYGLLPQPTADHFDAFASRYGGILLLVLFFTGIYQYIVGYPMQIVSNLLL